MPPPILTEAEIEVSQQIRECVRKFVQLDRGMNGREPIYGEIANHLDYLGKYKVVSWIRSNDHLKVDELAQKGIRLV